MFPQQPQQQFRTAGADVQIFYGAGGVANANQRTWNKPVGISHIYMMLIGGGGAGDGATGGGSGAVTVWYGAAQNVPNSLVVVPSLGTSYDTTVTARFSNSALTPTALLTASGASTTTGGTAMTANQFTASGFFQSVAGVNGSNGGQVASSTTFLQGGAATSSITSNYGYTTTTNGYFQLQPIIVGVGNSDVNNGVVGCGGGYLSGTGGPGMVLIASW
jgi:hypothetical protein